MKKGVPKSVDEYIAAQPQAVQPKLEQVRAVIRRAVPEAVEIIGYRMPGYKLHGKPILYFAGFKEHYSLFAASVQRLREPAQVSQRSPLIPNYRQSLPTACWRIINPVQIKELGETELRNDSFAVSNERVS